MTERETDEQRDKRAGSLSEALQYTQIGTMLVAPMVGFGAIGYFADRRFGTQPWLLLCGLLLGMVGGFVNFFRLVLPAKRRGAGPGDGAR